MSPSDLKREVEAGEAALTAAVKNANAARDALQKAMIDEAMATRAYEDARDVHPVEWRRLIDRMEDCGVVIEDVAAAPSAPADTALGRLQRWMVDGGTIGGGADGTLDSDVPRVENASVVLVRGDRLP